MHSLFIAPASSKEWFDQQAEALGNDGPALVLALSATSNSPATYGWCGVQLDAAQEAEVQAIIAANPGKQVDWTRYDMGQNPDHPDQRAAQLNLHRIQTLLP
ncbi:MAG: hypothetical protein FJ167_02465 [Gammaproteobacteria bacterium]|nr:hypothetical protein [Gammaproteobacteria bacterium]